MKFLILTALALSPLAFAAETAGTQVIEMKATQKGFEPEQIDVKAGTKVVLKVTRVSDATCATEIKIPSKKIKKELPLNKVVSIDLGKLSKGDVGFTCGMDMMPGKITVQ